MAKLPPAILELEDFTESTNMCIYGDSGVGKTVLAGTARDALFLSFEDATVSAKRQGSKAKLWRITKWADVEAAYNWLYDNPDVFRWVIVDSVTQMQKLCMRGILDAAAEDNKDKRDLDVPAQRDWQKYYNMFERFITAFNALPQNVIYTATTLRGENADGEDIILPDLQGKGYHNAQVFCASMDIVAYYKEEMGKVEEENTRKLLFRANPPYFAKDRYDAFPRWVRITTGNRFNTTMEEIDRKISAPVAPRENPKKATPVAKVATAKRPAKRRPANQEAGTK